MVSNFVLVLGGYLSVVGFGVLVFLNGKPEGNSFFDKSYRFFSGTLPSYVKKIAGLFCGKRGPQFVDGCWNYVVWTNNPLVQIFYLAIICAGYAIFVLHGYSEIPNKYIAEYHKYGGFAAFLICIYYFAYASMMDPGLVTSRNNRAIRKMFPGDMVIFNDHNVCRTEGFRKPARSKYCGLCKHTVAKFDHHCIWINNCVGLHNHWYFLMFLFWNATICLYCVALGLPIMYNYIDKLRLWDAVFIDPVTKERHTASYYVICQYLLATKGYLLFLTLLCGFMFVVLLGFFGWHMYLVLRATTSNEVAKWNMLRYALGSKYASECAEYKAAVAVYESQQKAIGAGEPLPEDEEVITEKPEAPEDLRLRLSNQYDKGWWQNLMLVVFPPDVHSAEFIEKWDDGSVFDSDDENAVPPEHGGKGRKGAGGRTIDGEEEDVAGVVGEGGTLRKREGADAGGDAEGRNANEGGGSKKKKGKMKT